MDFLNMNFCTLFCDKHGEKAFNNIIKRIIKKNSNKNDEMYIEIVFKIAFLKFLGINNIKIENIINDILPNQHIDIEEILLSNKKSIKQIQGYLDQTIKGNNLFNNK